MPVMRWCAAILVGAVCAATLTGSSSATPDPGVALYEQMHSRGATMPPAWAQTVDANRALICSHYNNGYAGYPPGDTDEWGVTVPMAKAAIAASGFC